MVSKRKRKFPVSIGDSLLSPERLRLIPPEEVVRAFNFGSGQTVLDLGCGPGAFLEALSRAVGEEGKVVAADIQEPFINMARRLASEKRLANVEFIVSRERHIPLEDESVDAALMINTLHELEGNYTLQELMRVMKKGGTLGVIEWQKVKSPIGPPLSERYSEEESESVLRDNGFEIQRIFALGLYHYAVHAVKPEGRRRRR